MRASGAVSTRPVADGPRIRFLRRGVAPAVAALTMACLDVASPARAPAHSATSSVAIELHVHGWSNHGATSEPASIEWQTAQAAAAGVRHIWWTDHDDIYANRVPDFTVAPETPTPIDSSAWVVGAWDGGSASAIVTAGARRIAGITTDGARVAVALGPGSGGADTVRLFLRRVSGTTLVAPALGLLARPLIGDPLLSFTVWRGTPTRSFPDVEVRVPLAWHVRSDGSASPDQIVYDVQSEANPALHVVGHVAVYNRAWSTGDSTLLRFILLHDADVFTAGVDNTIHEVSLQFVVPRVPDGDTIRFSFPTIVNADSGADTQMLPAEQRAAAAAAQFGIRESWGIETWAGGSALRGSAWWSVFGAGEHLAVYEPSPVTPLQLNTWSHDPATLVSQVHESGGVVAIAHPFGTGQSIPATTPMENYPAVAALGRFLVQHRAWNADMIEVGYPLRGGVTITEHLWLLDYLLASGIRICGVGATDSHGESWEADPGIARINYNNFASWVAGVVPQSSDSDVIRGFKRCDVSFGNPFYVSGGIWISPQPRDGGGLKLALDLAGVTPSAHFYLYEAEIDSSAVGHDVVYRQFGTEVHRGDAPRVVGGCRPGFARLEAWDGQRPIAFSNVVFVPATTTTCSAGLPVLGRQHGNGGPWPRILFRSVVH